MASTSSEWRVFATVDIIASNSLVPIREINGQWPQYHPSQGKNFALAIGQAQTGVQFGSWSFGVLDRIEWWTNANKDSADLIYRDKAKLGADPGHSYVLDYRLTGFDAKGVKLGKAFENSIATDWKLNWSSALSLLKGTRFRTDEVSGYGTVSNIDQITVSAQRDNADSNLNVSPDHFNPFVPSGKPSGQGYGIDLGMSLANASGYRLDLTVGDAIGRMYWKEIPQAKTIVNNMNYSYDSYGDRNSTIAGIDSRGNITQSIAPKTDFNFSAPISIGFIEIGDSYFHGVDFPEIGLGYRGTNWKTVATYETRTKSFGLAYAMRYFSIGVRSDSIHESEARTFGLSMNFHLPL